MLAKDGKSKPFDQSANGLDEFGRPLNTRLISVFVRFSRAEGCVVIVIKPLKDALRDHDRVYATVIFGAFFIKKIISLRVSQILGTSINSTGSAGPPGAPVAASQCETMKEAFERAGRIPHDVAYVELHATGMNAAKNFTFSHSKRSRDRKRGSRRSQLGGEKLSTPN